MGAVAKVGEAEVAETAVSPHVRRGRESQMSVYQHYIFANYCATETTNRGQIRLDEGDGNKQDFIHKFYDFFFFFS